MTIRTVKEILVSITFPQDCLSLYLEIRLAKLIRPELNSIFSCSIFFVLAFISSKIFNSSESLLEFLRKNVSENDKLIVGIKKRIYELIIEYSHHRPP